MKKELKPHFGYYNHDIKDIDKSDFLIASNKSIFLSLRSNFLSGSTDVHENIEYLKEKGYINFIFPFSNREEYLEWKKEWKELYKALSSFRRTNKAIYKQYWVNVNKNKMPIKEALAIFNEEYIKLREIFPYDYSYEIVVTSWRDNTKSIETRYYTIDKDYLTVLLAYYRAGKAEAQRQYLSGKFWDNSLLTK